MHIPVFSDPGHGWGKVSNHQLRLLGMNRGDFSNYSYVRGDNIFLEEDGDLTKFIARHVKVLGKPPTFRETSGNKSSRIRNYESNTHIERAAA